MVDNLFSSSAGIKQTIFTALTANISNYDINDYDFSDTQ